MGSLPWSAPCLTHHETGHQVLAQESQWLSLSELETFHLQSSKMVLASSSGRDDRAHKYGCLRELGQENPQEGYSMPSVRTN